MKKLFLYLFGLVLVELRGTSPERFLNICRSKKIPIYDISKLVTKKGTVTCAFLRLKDYKRIRPVARKSHCIPYLKKRIGFPFFLHRFKSRIVFFAGTIYFLWFVWLLSCFLFDIRISGGFLHTEDELLSYLKTQNIVCGMRRSDIDCAEIERRMRIDYPDIGWVSAELLGSKLLLRISETQAKQESTKGTEPVHLVAAADGIIEQLVIRTGRKMVSVGDVVRKGDILVSGVVPIIGDNETLVNQVAVKADADILMKTIKQYRCSVAAFVEEKQFSPKNRSGYSLYLGKQKIFSYLPSHPDSNYDIITKEFVPSELSKFPLLFRLTKTTVCEFTSYQRKLTKEEQEDALQRSFQRYRDYLFLHGTTILSAKLSKRTENNKAIQEGRLVLLSACYEEVPVLQEEWRTIENEYRGESAGSAGRAQ